MEKRLGGKVGRLQNALAGHWGWTRDVLEGKGPSSGSTGGWRRLPKRLGGGYCRLQWQAIGEGCIGREGPKQRFDRRLEEVTKAVGGRLLSVTMAGHWGGMYWKGRAQAAVRQAVGGGYQSGWGAVTVGYNGRPLGRDVLEGKGPSSGWTGGWRRLPKRLGGGYCRLRMQCNLALAVRGTVAGRSLGALKGRPPFQCIPGGGWARLGRNNLSPPDGHTFSAYNPLDTALFVLQEILAKQLAKDDSEKDRCQEALEQVKRQLAASELAHGHEKARNTELSQAVDSVQRQLQEREGDVKLLKAQVLQHEAQAREWDTRTATLETARQEAAKLSGALDALKAEVCGGACRAVPEGLW